MVESVGAAGGFLVPTEFLAQLQGVMAEDSLCRSRSTIIRMRRRQIDIPVLDQTGTTAGIPHWFGGMQFYWTEEATAKTSTDAAFRKIALVAHKLIGYTYASDELVADSAISLADFLSGPLGFAGGLAWMEDWAFINGTGAGQPLGVINAGATITVNRAAAPNVGLVDLLNMLENFLPSGRGVWFYTQSALRELMEISGPAGNASYVFMPSAREGVPGTIFGYPAIRTEKCPRLGTAGDFILGDWRYYLIGDRQATTVESTQFDRWNYDETSWRAVHRVDGQPWLSQPLTYQDGTTQVSPFVILGDKVT
jgi:HK97 family phage major capsid protein